MSDSELSSALSSPPSSEDEMPDSFPKPYVASASPRSPSSEDEAPNDVSSARKKRIASPPRDEVLADNPDIAFIVMFRSRFSDTFPAKLMHFGPQDIERGVVDSSPSPQVESLLCALLGLVLNRQKPVEQGHYGRALEESIAKQKSQWPRAWNGTNPLSGGRTFITMNPVERLTLLRALILWALHSSDAISTVIKESFKQSRHNDDLNQPLSVQPWGKDALNRQYWLIEGQDDTYFRLYREGNRKNVNISWRSEAGTIEELRVIAQKLIEDGGQASRRLSEKITNAIPRFEATEEKRKRREYRQSRKAAFSRPVDYGMYEGRTRGKRLRYTYSEDEDEDLSDATSVRRSARHSGRGTPAEGGKPTVTASGRQVRARVGGVYGESLLSGQVDDRATPMTGDDERSDMSDEVPSNERAARYTGRSRDRSLGLGHGRKRKHIQTYNTVDDIDDEDEAESSGAEWNNPDGDDEGGDDIADDEDNGFEDSLDEEEIPRSLVVRLKVPLAQLEGAAANQSGSTENTINSGSSINGNVVTSPLTATSIEGSTSTQNISSYPERLISQMNKPVFSAQPQNQMQTSISSYFHTASNG